MRYVGLFLLLVATVVCAAPDPFLIEPGQGFGQFRKGMGVEQMQKRVRPEEFGEGKVGGEPAVELYFMEPRKRVAMLLDERGTVRAMLIHGLASAWHTREGITLGTPLRTLEKLNRGPFKFHSMDASSDSGRIQDWCGGKLARTLPGVRITFASPMHARGYGALSAAEKVTAEASGRIFSSSEGVARRLDPVVETIELRL